MRGAEVSMHPWVTIKGPGATSGVIREVDKWVDAARYRLGVLQAEAVYASGGTLYGRGCDDVQAGSLRTHAPYATGASVAALKYLNKNVPYWAGNRLPHRILPAARADPVWPNHSDKGGPTSPAPPEWTWRAYLEQAGRGFESHPHDLGGRTRDGPSQFPRYFRGELERH